MDAYLEKTQYNFLTTEETIDPSLLLELPPNDELLAWINDGPYDRSDSAPFWACNENNASTLMPNVRVNAISTGVPDRDAGLPADWSSSRRLLLLDADIDSFLADQATPFPRPPEKDVNRLIEAVLDLIAMAKIYRTPKMKYSTIYSRVHQAPSETVLASLCDSILALENHTSTYERESKRGKNHVQSQTPPSEADDSAHSWTWADTSLIQTSSMLIDKRLSNCANYSIVLTKLSKRERRNLRAMAHLKGLNHLSFGKGVSRCLILSRYGILDRGKLTRTGCAFVHRPGDDWIDIGFIKLVACHKSCPSDCTYRRSCPDTAHRGCALISWKNSTNYWR